MFKEFKEFAMKGNVVDLAVGVIIAGAFGKIVTSLVDDIIMPPLGLLLKNVDFNNLFIVLGDKAGVAATTLAEAKKNAIPTVNYGVFITQIVNFIIVAFALFLVVKAMNRATRREEA